MPSSQVSHLAFDGDTRPFISMLYRPPTYSTMAVLCMYPRPLSQSSSRSFSEITPARK